ncbi:MAG: hypothetical protein AB1489_26890 [Acidobacteriota bacterium]
MSIEEIILADAKSRKPEYAARLILVEVQPEGLPAGIRHFSLQIDRLFDYIPINYIVIGDEYYCSLVKDDFAKLLWRFNLLAEKRLTARSLVTLFLLIGSPSRDRRMVERIEDITLPTKLKQPEPRQYAQLITPPSLQNIDDKIEARFSCFNIRSNSLENFLLSVNTDYTIGFEIKEHPLPTDS